MTDGQIRQVLMGLRKLDRGFEFHTTDRDILQHLDDISPYVVGYKQGVRGFDCDGISPLGKYLLE